MTADLLQMLNDPPPPFLSCVSPSGFALAYSLYADKGDIIGARGMYQRSIKRGEWQSKEAIRRGHEK